MKECIIITAYIEGSIREISDNGAGDALIICADAGYEKALAEGIRPDVIMGDFDSLEGTLPDDIKTFTFPARKDYTDTGLALKYALDNGFRKVTIIGGIGGRLDHTLANIQDIVGFSEKGLDITIKDRRNSLTVLGTGNYMLADDRFVGDEYFSVFAYTEKAVVSIAGAAYPLDHYTITNNYPLGVSNRVINRSACLTVHEGTVLFLVCK